MSRTHAPAMSPGRGIRPSKPATPIAASTEGTTSARYGRSGSGCGRSTSRACHTTGAQRPEAFRSELLCIIEIDADERVVARVSFNVEDIDAAFEELDAR